MSLPIGTLMKDFQPTVLKEGSVKTQKNRNYELCLVFSDYDVSK